MVYSYGKLLGQIKERGMTQETLAFKYWLTTFNVEPKA